MDMADRVVRHQAAPDRPRDLHPLQHLRGDLPGAARSRTTRATTWSMPASATCAWPASRPAPPARSTTGARCRACEAYSVDEQLGWDELPAELTRRAAGRRRRRRPTQPARSQPAAPSLPAGRRRGEAAVQRRAATAPRCRPGRPRMPTPTSTARRRPRSRSPPRVVGQRARHRGRPRVRHAPHRARLRRDAVPGARRPVDRHRRRRASTPAAGRTTRASTRSPARATASGRATTTCR